MNKRKQKIKLIKRGFTSKEANAIIKFEAWRVKSMNQAYWLKEVPF